MIQIGPLQDRDRSPLHPIMLSSYLRVAQKASHSIKQIFVATLPVWFPKIFGRHPNIVADETIQSPLFVIALVFEERNHRSTPKKYIEAEERRNKLNPNLTLGPWMQTSALTHSATPDPTNVSFFTS